MWVGDVLNLGGTSDAYIYTQRESKAHIININYTLLIKIVLLLLFQLKAEIENLEALKDLSLIHTSFYMIMSYLTYLPTYLGYPKQPAPPD